MKYIKITCCVILLYILLIPCGCSETDQVQESDEMLITFDMQHPALARATTSAFEKQDQIGVYMTGHGIPLEVAGNFLNNERLTFDGTKWNPARKLYWDEGSFDVFAYYPYIPSPSGVDDLPFSVALDQSATSTDSGLDGYEASDFLWATDQNVTASDSPVSLSFKHRMSKMVVRLMKGKDYDGDIPEDAEVYIHNTVPSATIDLSVGIVTRNTHGTAQTIKAKKVNKTQYTAIVVPQRLTNQVPLVEVVMKGVSYMVESKFVFNPGIQHTLSVTISKNPEQVKIEIGGEIEDWED